MCLIFFKDEVSSVRLDKKINPPPLTIVPAPLDLQGGGNNFERDVPPPSSGNNPPLGHSKSNLNCKRLSSIGSKCFRVDMSSGQK